MSSVMYDHDIGKARTEIESYANMVVVGKHATIFSDAGNKVNVSTFTPDYQSLGKLSMVDAAVEYMCQ